VLGLEGVPAAALATAARDGDVHSRRRRKPAI
jgi:hypothetical protein